MVYWRGRNTSPLLSSQVRKNVLPPIHNFLLSLGIDWGCETHGSLLLPQGVGEQQRLLGRHPQIDYNKLTTTTFQNVVTIWNSLPSSHNPWYAEPGIVFIFHFLRSFSLQQFLRQFAPLLFFTVSISSLTPCFVVFNLFGSISVLSFSSSRLTLLFCKYFNGICTTFLAHIHLNADTYLIFSLNLCSTCSVRNHRRLVRDKPFLKQCRSAKFPRLQQPLVAALFHKL